MTALGSIAAGARITAAMLQGIAPLAVIKGADESVTSSTTVQADDALFAALEANASYLFVCFLDYEGNTEGSGDIKWNWALPSGATLRYHAIHETPGGAADNVQCATGTTVVTAGTKGTGTLCGATMAGSIIGSSTAGTLQLQWAQNTSSGTATIVHAQSFLSLWQIS